MINEKHLKETIDVSINAFYSHEEKHRLSTFEFLFEQLQFIEKKWWLFQAFLLISMWIMFMQGMDTYVNRVVISLGAPVFAILLLPELWKNRYSNSLEIETCSVYKLRSVYAARLVLFGMVDLVMMTIFFVVSIVRFENIDSGIIFEFLVPFNCVCIFLLNMVSSFRDIDVSIGVSVSLVFTVLWIFIISNNSIYDAISMYLWIGFLFVSILFLMYTINRVLKTTKEMYSWS